MSSPPSATAAIEYQDFFVGLPEEPVDFYPPSPPASSRSHTLTTAPNEKLSLSLVGHNPLWGHMLWNAGIVLSTYIESQASTLVHGKTVLELGAGAGLPSLVCALRGATKVDITKVVVTDYPDLPLIRNLDANIATLPTPETIETVLAEPYLWGNDPEGLLAHIGENQKGFDVLLLSDLLFNHSEHGKLAETVVRCLKRDSKSRALVFFTPHRPWLYEKDLDFFNVVKELGFEVEKVLEKLLEAPMFEEDKGDRDLRRTVFGYELRWVDKHLKG